MSGRFVKSSWKHHFQEHYCSWKGRSELMSDHACVALQARASVLLFEDIALQNQTIDILRHILKEDGCSWFILKLNCFNSNRCVLVLDLANIWGILVIKLVDCRHKFVVYDVVPWPCRSLFLFPLHFYDLKQRILLFISLALAFLNTRNRHLHWSEYVGSKLLLANFFFFRFLSFSASLV